MTSKTRTKGTRRETKRDQTEQAEGQTRGAPAEAVSMASRASASAMPPAAATAPSDRRPTKALQLREMLAREDGASLAQMMEATGWQAHTVRAALSGLRKSGLTLTRTRQDQDTIYRIVVASAGGAAPASPESQEQKADDPVLVVGSGGQPDASPFSDANTSGGPNEVTS